MQAALDAWEERLRGLCDEIRACARAAMRSAMDRGALHEVDRPVAEGAGDVSFGLDLPTEAVVTRWLEQRARRSPLSLLSEESGWRHLGPDPDAAHGAPIALAGFDHGGPRIVVDPVDGTRNLMADLRPAWTALALCPPGPDQPRLSDVTYGLLAEIPDSRAARYRVLQARAGGGASMEERDLERGRLVRARPLVADGDDRADHGYFPFFCFDAAMRPALAAVAAEFFARLEREERARVEHCFDDQYICNAGQLALLALGTYRLVADLRAALLERVPAACTTSKPYDCAGAILVARETGCIVTAPDGSQLDFPLDARTAVGFVGWANRATHERLGPHLAAALAARRQ